MLAERIAHLRNQRGLTQQELAEGLNLSQRTVAAWEGGSRKPSYETLWELADFFDVTTDYLLGRTDIPNVYKQPLPQTAEKAELSPAMEAAIRSIVDQALSHRIGGGRKEK